MNIWSLFTPNGFVLYHYVRQPLCCVVCVATYQLCTASIVGSGENNEQQKQLGTPLAPRNEQLEPTQQWRKVWKNNVSYSKEPSFNVRFPDASSCSFFWRNYPIGFLDPWSMYAIFIHIYNYICWIVYWIWVNIHGWYGHDFQNMNLFAVQKLKTQGWYNQPTSICIHSWLGCPTWSTPHFRRPCLQSQIHPVSWFRQLIHASLTKNTNTSYPKKLWLNNKLKAKKNADPRHPLVRRTVLQVSFWDPNTEPQEAFGCLGI